MQEKTDLINDTSLPPEALREAVSAAIEDQEISSRLQRLRGLSRSQIMLVSRGLDLYYAGTKVVTLLESDLGVSVKVKDYLRRVRTMQGMLAMPYPDSYKDEFREYEGLRTRIHDALIEILAA